MNLFASLIILFYPLNPNIFLALYSNRNNVYKPCIPNQQFL